MYLPIVSDIDKIKGIYRYEYNARSGSQAIWNCRLFDIDVCTRELHFLKMRLKSFKNETNYEFLSFSVLGSCNEMIRDQIYSCFFFKLYNAECVKCAYFSTKTYRPWQQNARGTSVNTFLHAHLSCKTGCNILCLCVHVIWPV